MSECYSTGQAAAMAGLPRWKLIYLIERGLVPGPSLAIPGRRLFTRQDVDGIRQAMADRPDLRGPDFSVR
jgi:DNA-binding transcriptional MerR regulator